MLVAYIVTVTLLVGGLLLAFRRERTSARELIREVDRQTRLREARENELLRLVGIAFDKPLIEDPPEATTAEDDEPDEELTWDLSFNEGEEALTGSGGTF